LSGEKWLLYWAVNAINNIERYKKIFVVKWLPKTFLWGKGKLMLRVPFRLKMGESD
jgi:hypothetical protein